MKFSIFETAMSQKGQECTYEKFLDVTNDPKLLELCKKIAAETDPDKRGLLKKKLPAVTWQAYFDGKRQNKNARPSGLFMLDIDHVDDPYELYNSKIAKRINELGILFVGKTASCHGLRIVAKCLPTLTTIADCQRWLASNLKVEYDGVCKDFARCSFLVHDSYTYFMNAGGLFQSEPAAGTVYSVDHPPFEVNQEMEELLSQAVSSGDSDSDNKADVTVDQREGLFGGQTDYRGIPLEKIATEWLEQTGGIPTKGERNARLFKLALRLRYITDFNEATLLRIMPTCGLPDFEIKSLVHSAVTERRAGDMPRDLREVISNIEKRNQLAEQLDDDIDEEIITDTSELPPLPPVIRQYVECAPDDFKPAVALCQLPILGSLGSKLRAVYLDGKEHSPSFQVSLEAPQASGKSFLRMLVNEELAMMMEHDEEAREREREYDNKIKELKLLNMKVDKKNKDEILGERPKSIIRFVPATMSITKLLIRMNDAKGLHLFAVSEEIDTVTKAFKRGFSSYSDLLRVAFDNSIYGQDYASENSFSGNIPIYYNFLTSGTPKAMRRFYPDVEDGLVSRVCFVTLPDQFGKPIPLWKTMTDTQRAIVDLGLVRLNEVSLQGEEVQPPHFMKMDWLNKTLQQWLVQQQQLAVKEDDRTRDIFCRRSAVVGFRAGMLAWFLYGEKNTPTIRKNVMRWSVWVANSMLNQHLLRFNVTSTSSNTNPFEALYRSLPDEFTREMLQEYAAQQGVESSVKVIIYNWRLGNMIQDVEKKNAKNGKLVGSKFKKIK